MNVLFLNEVDCFPPNNGEKLRTHNLIYSILEFCDHLHLVTGNSPPREEFHPKASYHVFPENFRNHNRWKNLPLLFRTNKKLVRTIEDILDRANIDVAILDYDFIGNYIDIFKKRNIKVVYGTHNVQSHLNYQSPAEGFKDLLYKKMRYSFERLHEDIFFRKADSIICVSENDERFYRKRFKNSKVFVIPNYINEKDYELQDTPKKKAQVIMAANYSAFQNRYGLEWFIKNVWDKELAAQARFVIAGHESVRELEYLRKKGFYTENTVALGSVDDMKGHIAESKVAIIPLLHGSGTRLKCIEAMALKTNIVSTTVGIEGIDHKGSILLADEPSDFRKYLKKILNDQISNEEKAYSVFLEKYSSKINTRLLEYILTN